MHQASEIRVYKAWWNHTQVRRTILNSSRRSSAAALHIGRPRLATFPPIFDPLASDVMPAAGCFLRNPRQTDNTFTGAHHTPALVSSVVVLVALVCRVPGAGRIDLRDDWAAELGLNGRDDRRRRLLLLPGVVEDGAPDESERVGETRQKTCQARSG